MASDCHELETTQAAIPAVSDTVCLYSGAFAAQNAQDLYQQALVQERAAGNLEKAIELFQSAVREAGGDRELAAKALIGAARCYEKLGQNRSRELYEQVARSYPDQAEQAAMARERVASSATPFRSIAQPNPEPTLQFLMDRLRGLREQAVAMSQRFTPEHPEMANLRAEIAVLEERLREVRNLSVRYDMTRPITITGKVIRWEFINPNVRLDVETADGRPVYHVNGDAPSVLVRQGIKRDMIRVGDVVTVSGFLATDGSQQIGIATVHAPGGQIFLGNSFLH